MTMREELALRLARLQWSTMTDEPGRPVAIVEIDSAQGPGTTWGDLADECIRQMEWARGLYMKSEGVGPIKVVPGLTLAPEDWKP